MKQIEPVARISPLKKGILTAVTQRTQRSFAISKGCAFCIPGSQGFWQ
jgi:hypothetical protein